MQIQKFDWSEPKSSLKVRVNTKLSVYQAAATLQIKSLISIDSDGKSSKRLLHGTLALLIEAAEACLFSVWRKLRVCEELFSSLLAGISQIAVTRGGQLLRVLLIRFKPLVLTICAQVNHLVESRLSVIFCSQLIYVLVSVLCALCLSRRRLTLGEAIEESCMRVS